jgi:hypothetical protein
MTSDGKDFSALTEKEVDGLADTEYDRYQKWKITQKKAKVIVEEQRLKENGAKVIETTRLADKEGAMVIVEEQRLKENGAKVIAKYTEYIDLFNQLHSMR